MMAATRSPRRKKIVIKVGGAVLDDLGGFWPQVKQLSLEAHVVIVHGGGAKATALARRLGHEPRVISGRRVTKELDLQIVQWTMRGETNMRLVTEANQSGLRAVGLCGADAGLLQARKRAPRAIGGEVVDFGWVGEVVRVRTDFLDMLARSDLLPIIAPLGVDENGLVYNVNADTVAGALAMALRAQELLLVTAAGGLRRESHKASTLLPRCTQETYDRGLAAGWITDGMSVKLSVALDSVRSGIKHVFVVSASDIVRREHATRVVL